MTAPLPNAENRPIKKGSAGSCANRFQRRHGTFAPPHMHGCQYKIHFFDPDPSALGRGQLFLIGVRCQQQDKGHSDKQDEKTSPHGCPSLSMCAVPGAGSGGQPCTRGSIALFPARGKASASAHKALAARQVLAGARETARVEKRRRLEILEFGIHDYGSGACGRNRHHLRLVRGCRWGHQPEHGLCLIPWRGSERQGVTI